MAKVKKNLLLQGLSGSVGGTIVLRSMGDKTIVASLPGKRNKLPSPGQLLQQERFKEGSDYSRSVKANPTELAEYKARAKSGESPLTLALTDYLRAPKVTVVDTAAYKGKKGDLIRIRAVDDFLVKSVKVQVLASDGSLFEEGMATLQANGMDWLYKGSTDVLDLTGAKIVATAMDKPGNIGVLEKAL